MNSIQRQDTAEDQPSRTTNAAARKKKWLVTLEHVGTRKTKEITMPGGLHEAQARQSAALKAGTYWRPVSASLIAC